MHTDEAGQAAGKARMTARRLSARQWLIWGAGAALSLGLLVALAAVTAL
jgi:hypothetical protein